jgi:filamentous hemagglutinin
MGGGGIEYRSDGPVEFPSDDSQLRHIFDKRPGHVEDTPENRALLKRVGSDEGNFVGTKPPTGVLRYAEILEDGTEVWVEVLNKIIQNGGINTVPRYFK